MTKPLAIASIGALSSSTSACSRICSSSASTPWHRCLRRDPERRASRPRSLRAPPLRPPAPTSMTRSMLASGLSILFIATTIGTLAALACEIASLVCGMTPSSAATTRMTMSVALAPRARIAVKAAWPGVSRKVIMPRGVFDVIGADVLRDAARFAGRDTTGPDVVEQRGLAVVDVAHDGDDRRARHRFVLRLRLRSLPRGRHPGRRAWRPSRCGPSPRRRSSPSPDRAAG